MCTTVKGGRIFRKGFVELSLYVMVYVSIELEYRIDIVQHVV